MQRVLYPLSVLAAPSTGRQTLIYKNESSNQEKKIIVDISSTTTNTIEQAIGDSLIHSFSMHSFSKHRKTVRFSGCGGKLHLERMG